jgi:hypothetical protein
MRPDEVVVVVPTRDDLAPFSQTQESMLAQAFVPKSTVEDKSGHKTFPEVRTPGDGSPHLRALHLALTAMEDALRFKLLDLL